MLILFSILFTAVCFVNSRDVKPLSMDKLLQTSNYKVWLLTHALTAGMI